MLMMMLVMMMKALGQCPLVLLLRVRCWQVRAVKIKTEKVKGDKLLNVGKAAFRDAEW
jgi:hypothetical protein